MKTRKFTHPDEIKLLICDSYNELRISVGNYVMLQRVKSSKL